MDTMSATGSRLGTGRRLGTAQSQGNLSVSSRMSDQRRQKLMDLKKREDLKDALTEKFKSRFGQGRGYRDPDEASVASVSIKREVDRFAEVADVTEANLNRLERRLQTRAQKAACGDTASVSGVSAYSAASRRSRSLASLAGESVLKSSQVPDVYDWSRLDEYASYLHEQDALRQKMGTHALQRKLRADLDMQVREKQSKKDMESEEERRYHQNSMVELERWKQAEQIRAEELRQKIMREKHDRDEQLKFEQRLKSEEEQRTKNEETNLVEKIINEMESEQDKFEKKKAQRKKAMRKVFEENMEDQRKRDEEHRATQAREAEAMREYNRILDEQEEQRADELAQRMDRQKSLMESLQANVAAQAKNAGDNDAQRAAAQQAEMDRHFFEAESTKMKRLKEMKIENQAYLTRQMAEKDGRKDEEKELQNIQAQILMADTEEYNQIERQKVIDRRMRNFDHRQDLEKQIMSKTGTRAVPMSETEMKMNKPLLNLVHRTLEQKAEHMPPATYDQDDED